MAGHTQGDTVRHYYYYYYYYYINQKKQNRMHGSHVGAVDNKRFIFSLFLLKVSTPTETSEYY